MTNSKIRKEKTVCELCDNYGYLVYKKVRVQEFRHMETFVSPLEGGDRTTTATISCPKCILNLEEKLTNEAIQNQKSS